MKHPARKNRCIRKREEKFVAESLQCDDEKTFAGTECTLHRT
jgi:hypothetical protein